MTRIFTVALSLLVAAPASAQDFSEGSEANSWNLYAEVPARFEATVVDPLCVLAGECADDCGDGRRQLALLRTADDVLVLPLKNNQPAFTGATNELQPFCGQDVEVDGLMIDDPDIGATNIYLVQRIRSVGAEEWVTANKWTRDWAEANPDAGGQGPWFRRDPRVLAEIEAEGWLGLGPDAEREFLLDWLPE
ncbi:MAG: hypothetical protein AAFU80_14215 [Pseudomonadota bacterium]